MNKTELKNIVEAIREKTPRGWILMSPNSIGEVLITSAFARSLIKKYAYPITLCVRPEHAPMVEALYPNRFTAVVPMNMELMRAFSLTGFIPDNHFDIDFPINLSPLHYGGGKLLDFHNLIYKRGGGSGLSLTDVWRSMLHLDWDAAMERPCLDFFLTKNPILSSLGVERGKYGLFQPGNNTNMPTPAAFWTSLEDRYCEKHFPVLANAHGSMLVDRNLRFNWARQLKLSILDALYLAFHSKAIVSGNNGLTLVAAFLDYPDEFGQSIHIITSDKYCKHYNKINSQWNEAFVPYDGQPSISLGAPELIWHSSKVHEWNIKSDLDDKAYEEAATDIFAVNTGSPFHNNTNQGFPDRNFPDPVMYSKN
jgi:hypothetical protein